MLKANIKHLKATKYLISGLLIFFSVVFVYAQFYGDTVTVRTINIFPAEIEAEGWNNVETLTFQNLDEYSLLQEFNSINSATLNTSASKQRQLQSDIEDDNTFDSNSASTSNEEQSDTETSTVNDDGDVNSPEEAATAPADPEVNATTTDDNSTSSNNGNVTEVLTPADTTSTQTTSSPMLEEVGDTEAQEENNSTEEPAEADSSDSSTTTVLRRVGGLFALAVDTVTQALSGSTSEEDSDTQEEATESQVEEVDTADDVVFGLDDEDATSTQAIDQSTEPTTTNEAEETVGDNDEQDTADVTETNNATTSGSSNEPVNATNTTTTTEETTADDSIENSTTTVNSTDGDQTTDSALETTDSETEIVVNDCVEDCVPYIIELNNFGYPIDEAVEVSGAQLRISMAGKKKAHRERIPMMEVRYSVDSGASWNTGGSVIFEDEVSNSINGGYFLFSLPEVSSEEDLYGLRVRLVYKDNPDILEDLYIESTWLELFTLETSGDELPSNISDILADNGYNPDILSGDELTLPNGEQIRFEFTDDNSDETLIIKSDKETYQGLAEATTYFNITNTSDRADEINIQAYFPDGLGEVSDIQILNPNKPKEVVVPEYRPYVYHCEAGWEYEGEFEAGSLNDLSRQLSAPENENGSTQNNQEDQQNSMATSSEESIEFDLPATTSATTSGPDLEMESNNTTTVMSRLSGVSRLLQSTVSETVTTTDPSSTDNIPASNISATSPELTSEVDTASNTEATIDDEEINEDLVIGYSCRNTNIVRECDSIDGGGTACRVDQVKVQEHQVTQYQPGWEKKEFAEGDLPRPGLLRRAAEFIGFGPDRKEVPDRFEVRAHTPNEYRIEPGETLYFKMEVAFSPRSNGEYWIEAIGSREYGLLDPFWQSAWRKRLPISIDNIGNASSSEQQVFLELDSSLTGFWNNVREDGGDIRFVQESFGNQTSWYDTSWSNRQSITIQASEIDSDLTDFPTYIDLSTLGDDFWDIVKTDGGDIRITEGNGTTEVPYELVSFDDGGEDGELHFLASEISSTNDTTFYIYYGNESASGYADNDTFGSEAVWANGFHAVYHFSQDPSGSVPQVIDSTSNGFDATTGGSMTTADLVTGQIGQAYDLDGSNDYAFSNAAGSAVDGTGQYSVSFWSEADDIGADIPYYIFNTDGYASGQDDRNAFRIDPSGFSSTGNNLYKIGVYTSTGFVAGETTTNRTTTNWTHLGLTWNSGDEPVTYQDGLDTGYNPGGGAPGALAGTVIADVLSIGRGNKEEWFDGRIDEFRLHSVARPAEWLGAEHSNMSAPTNFYATSTTETLSAPSFSELDHWVQYFSTSTQEADIWVQVDELEANASTTIYLYYDNPLAESTSDEYAPFTYSAPLDLYYVVSSGQTTPLVVYSLIDDNTVTLGASSTVLQSGESFSFTNYDSTSVISANGPITARATDDGSDNVVPISFASTTLVIPSTRGTESAYTYAPYSDAFVEMFNGNSGTPVQSGTTNANDSAVYTNNNNQATIIESDEPVLVFSRNGNNDSLAVYPPTLRDLYGIRSNTYAYSPTESATDVDIFCSSGATGSNTNIDRGSYETNTVCGGGGSGTGNAIRLANQTSPLSAIQQADGSGTESSIFLPTPEFGTRYVLPQAADYVSVVCSPRFGTTTIELQSVTGSVLESETCITSGDLPGALNFNNATVYAPGTQVVSPEGVPFYIYFEEDSRSDESNTWSAVQAKQFRALELQSSFGAEEENNDAQYTQNNFAWYENIDSATATDRYSLGEEDAAEGENISSGGAVNPGDELRLRINLAASNGTGTIGSTAFKLQYAESVPDQCTNVVGSAWIDVPSPGSTTAAFTGLDNPSVNDGVPLNTSLLSDSNVLATYEESNISAVLPNQVNDGDFVEFDWAITAESPGVNTNYCFRMVRSAGQELFAYDVFPSVETAGPPEVPVLLTPFSNEHTPTTEPAFEFFANDVAGDDIDYQIQISTDNTFATVDVDRQSDVNLFDFENVEVPADKAPFNNSDRVRFNLPSNLSDGETYWWRVRAADPDGSASFGDWSQAQSFTINTSVTVTEWFQTTDEQFETDTLDSAQTTGSDSVELDIAGGNLIGEYGSLTVNVGATTTVNLNNTYTNPVVVTSHRYSRSVADGDQPIIRVFNKGSNSFDFLAYTFDFEAVGTTTVDYIVAEAGEYLMDDGDDGTRVFATSTSVSTVQGRSVPNDPGGIVINFPTSFSGDPTVLSAVTTNNDPQWVVSSVYDGNSRGGAPTATQVGLYLNDSLASDGHGSAEDIDIIAFDQKANGVNNGVTFGVQSTPNSVSDTPFTETFNTLFSSVPGVIMVGQHTMNGADGGYSMIDTDTPPTNTTVTVAAEEGGTDGNRGHANETLGIVSLESNGGDLIRGSNGQITSTAIDFDDVKIGNAWGEVSWNSTGDISVRVQYQTGSGFQNIPDTDLPGNSTGFTSSPINLVDLNTETYNELRLVAVLSGVNPELFDWTVSWGQRVETPTLGDPFDNEKIDTTTPEFDFTTTDPQSDDLEYEISISTDPTFGTGVTTFNSGSDAGFSNLTNGADTNPFNSGDNISYTTQSALTDGETYWWRVRAKDPAGEDSFSPWSVADSFTVDTSVTVSTWHQTTQAQFSEGLLDGTFASTSNSTEVSPTIGEYGTTILTDNEWQVIETDLNYQNMVVVATPEYAFDDSDANGRTARVRNKTTNSFEVKVDDHTNAFSGSTEVDYVVMEAGDWVISDGGSGTRIIAGTAEDVANVKGNTSYDDSVGEIVSFSPSFSSAPGAVLTVSSDNDTNWVGTHMDDGSDRRNSITTSQMNVSLARSRADTFHAPEDVDYITFAVADGVNNGVLFDAFNTATNVGGSATAANYNQTGFTTAPVVTVTQQNANRAGQGSFSQKDTAVPSTASTLYLSASEIGPGADGHANAEMVSVLAFEASNGFIERDTSSAGGLSGTIRSETIDFFDGNGPRFEQFFWNATTPGVSEVRLQVEYFDGNNWNLVPDDDWYDLNWTRRIPITLQASEIEDDLVDFPVYVDLSDFDNLFWDNVLANGEDIRVTESDGVTELPVDVSFINTASDVGELHFKADLASTTNQTFYIYFGNLLASPYPTPEDVWSDYSGVWHMDNGSASNQIDSSGNGNTAVYDTGGSDVAGFIGRGLDFNGNGEYNLTNSITNNNNRGFSFWYYKRGQGGGDFGSVFGSNNFSDGVRHLSTDELNVRSGGSVQVSTPTLANNAWHYVSFDWNGVNWTARTNGVAGSGAGTSWFGNDPEQLIGIAGNTNRAPDGILDEMRVGPARSIAWRDTEYNNQLNTGAFYTTGTVQQSSGDALIGNNTGFTGGGPVDISGLDANVYNKIRLLATLECDSGDCPTLDDWSVEWGEGVLMTGTLRASDRITNVPSGTVRVAVNGVLQAGSGSVSNGNWSIGNVTAFAGDTITVYVEGAPDANRAATVFVYNGAGNMTGVEMYEGHLTLAGDNSEPLNNSNIGLFDNSVALDPDVFFDIDGSNNLSVCSVANCTNFSLYITNGISYRPSDISVGDLSMGSFINEGTFTLDGNTMWVGGNWSNQATSSLGNGEIIFTATAGDYIVTDHTNQLNFPTLTFGESSGSATWRLLHPLTVADDWTIDYGTVDRFSAPMITANGNVSVGSNGLLLGSGTTTFAGTGANSWSDASSGQNFGNVVINGNSKTVSVTSDVYANNLLIGSDDTLQGGSGNTIHIGGDFTNSGTFTPNTSNIELVDDERGRLVAGIQTEPWYDTDWSSRYLITIQASEIDDDLTDFPVTIDLSDLPADFWGEVRNNGGDIRVTTADATTEVPREVSAVNVGNQTGELYFKAPNLSSTTDTTFYIYFGNAAATEANLAPAYQATEVWSDYEGVWHFAEGFGSIANDSTGNGNDGTLVGSPVWTSGIVGGALEFNGNGNSGNLVELPGILSGTATATVSVWFTQDAVESGDSEWTYVLHSSPDQNVGSSEFWLGRLGSQDPETGDIGATFGGWSAGLGHTGVPLVSDNRYYHVTAVQANGEVRIYVDGQLETTRSQSMFTFGGEDWGVGAAQSGYRSHPGIIDSPRISTEERSTAWVAAEYSNVSNPNNFYSIGSAEGVIGVSVAPATTHEVTTGGDNFYRFTMNDPVVSAAFIESEVVVQNDFSIATGTLALPTTRLSVGGDFSNTGGVFTHNNSEVRFTGSGSKTIEQQGTEFLNAFYNVIFAGSGNWTYLDTNATTTNTYRITNGNVTFPTGSLTVGDDFTVSGSGSFNANGGETIFLVEGEPADITPRTSSFANVRIRDLGGATWLDNDFGSRLPITISASEVDNDLTNFPVFVDLNLLGSEFFNRVESDGADIRVTEDDGLTQVPVELVSIDTGSETGELHFRATSLSSTTDSTFYIYFDNPDAEVPGVATAFGRNNVWSNGYEAVFHLNETSNGTTGEFVDSTGNGRDATGGGGNSSQAPSIASSPLGTGQDFNDGQNQFITNSLNASGMGVAGTGDKAISLWANIRDFNNNGLFEVGSNSNLQDYSLRALSGTDTFRVQHWGGGNDIDVSYPPAPNNWVHYALDFDGTQSRFIADGGFVAQENRNLNTGNDNPFRIGLWRTDYFDGIIDEVRVSSVSRSIDWYSAENANQSNVSNFIATSSIEQSSRRIFTNTNVDIDDDLVIESGLIDFPTGLLTIGGSLDNDGMFNNRGGTVEFDSSAGSESIAVGNSLFYNLVFDNPAGNFTVTESATATNAINLNSASEFTLNSGLTLETLGTFSSAHNAATTTWTGSTLRLSGTGDYAVNNKTTGGDNYGTLSLVDGLDISMWNSSADTYVTDGSSSVYSQDHAEVDGDLYIFGEYTRNTGTEYWNYATDFDGADLTGGNERQVNVRIASSSVVTIDAATLSVVGDPSATSTVASINNAHSLELISSNLNAEYFSFAGGGMTGVQLSSSTEISQLENGTFIAMPNGAGLTVDDSTVAINNTEQYQNISFGTTVFGAIGGVVTEVDGITHHTFTTDGTFSVNSGSGDVSVNVVGAGGGGGNSTGGGPANAGGGGGGGAFAQSTTTVSSGQSFAVTVGTGGTAQTSGGSSSFDSGATLVEAAGGTAGVGTTPGSGGTVGASTGDTRFAGGNGAQRGGGGAAGTSGAGGNASGDTGGAGATLYGGSGANGGGGNSNGLPGNDYGGGGSGARGGGNVGGAGADGVVVVSYENQITNTVNVSFNGVAGTDYIWFRNGGGVLYGEQFDDDDGDPGVIRWDDSNYTVNISGTVFSDDGVTPFGNPTCNGSDIVRIVANNGTFTDITGCNAGAYSFTNVPYEPDTSVYVYLDSGGGEVGTVITKGLLNDVADLDIYANRVIVRSESFESVTIEDLLNYDESDDADIRFVATAGTPNTLTVRSDTELYVASSTTFVPEGDIILETSGSGNPYDGSLRLADNSIFTANGTELHQIGGSFFAGASSSLHAASSTFEFTSNTTGRTITNDNLGTLDFYELAFTGVGGSWNLNSDIAVDQNMTIDAGTVTGTGDITLENGSLSGGGVLSMGGGTTTIKTSTTLGGSIEWTFFDLVLGAGLTTGTTTRSDNATTTISGQLVISPAHFLDAGNSNWDFAGSGEVFVENGTFLEDTSTVTYSGDDLQVLSTNYYNLVLAGEGGTPTYSFGSLGVLIENDFTVAGSVPTVADLNLADPLVQVLGDLTIGNNGTLEASDTNELLLDGSYSNSGNFAGNGGEVIFQSSDTYTVSAGNSPFSNTSFIGEGQGTISSNATSTGSMVFASTSEMVIGNGVTLAVGDSARIETSNTTWTGSTLSLYGGDYELNPKTLSVPLDNLVLSNVASVRTWNTAANNTSANNSASLYSQDHDGVDGDLYIYGAYSESTRFDHWSYATDFDGEDLTGSERQTNVYLNAGASADWTGGGLTVIGTSTIPTTIQNQGSGNYSLTIGGNTNTEWDHAVIRDIDADGLTFTDTPNVVDMENIDLVAEINGATTMTVEGSVITASPARNFSNFTFNSDIGVTGATNVTATGNTTSGWKFSAHGGNLDGEDNDLDPAGDPGYIIWDDSAAIITISGNVYEADGTTVSSVCDDSTANIALAVAGNVAQNASSSCASADGSYSISGVSFGSLDELTLYINDEGVEGVTVSKDPISSIADMDIYERHVILRHEGTNPITLNNAGVWDSSNDSDIPFNVTAGPNTMTLDTDTKLLVWDNKDFEPGGDLVIPGGGSGDVYDGTLEMLNNSTLIANGTESFSVGGNLIFNSGSTFTPSESTFDLTSNITGRNVTLLNNQVNNLTFSGTGSWTMTDSNVTILNSLNINSGSVNLPTNNTIIGGSFVNNGSFTHSSGLIEMNSADSGETITLGGSDVNNLLFSNLGDWSFGDTNATINGYFQVATGTVTLPSGNLSVGADFVVADSIDHNSGTLELTNNTGNTELTLSGNDLNSVVQSGAATTLMTDVSATFLGDLDLQTGEFTAASNTLSIGGSLDVESGVFNTGTGTIQFIASTGGHEVRLGSNEFYNAVFSGPSGGWTLYGATTTNNFSLTSANSFTLASGDSLTVGGVFLNNVGGSATDWTNTTLKLNSGTDYSINEKDTPVEQYENLIVENDTNVKVWNSSAVNTEVNGDSSLYSQDHANSDGQLNIYGLWEVGTTTEHWSYGRDFNGDILTGGSVRPVTVSLIGNTDVIVSGNGNLQIIGGPSATTTIVSAGTGQYTFTVEGGTINWDTYAFRDIPFNGIVASSTPVINSLANGDFEVSQDGGTAIRLSQSTLDANPSLTIPNTRFELVSPAGNGVNIRLSATSTNAWNFTGSYGDLSGEDFDIDGTTDCGSIRWGDSSCLLTEQTEYRWRNNDGGLGVPDSEWFDDSFEHRQQVRVANNDSNTYNDIAVNFTVSYDSDMQSDFSDLRFTAGDGVTLTDHWIEKVSAGTEAEVWVVVPELEADTTSAIYMYYGSSTANSVSSGEDVFTAFDDFEDNNISEYSGNTSQFQTNTSLRYGGSYGLRAVSAGDFTTDGIARFDQTVSQNETIRTRLYVDAGAGDADEQCTLFGVQSPVTSNQNYGVCIIQFGTERVSLAKDIERNDTFGGVSQLATQNYNFTTSGWYEIEVDWKTDNSMFVRVYNPDGNLIATTTASDSTYTSGGFGYTYWTNNGAWDGFHSRAIVESKPNVFIGNKQQAGGASYAADQSTPTSAFEVGDTARLRIAIENTGLDITDQQYQIEYAGKGTAPSCAAVPSINYSAVPNTSSCGSSGICMATSTDATNGDSTSDLLLVGRNDFVAGQYVEDPNNQTGLNNLNQNNYTELEYALRITENVADEAYCFRVTNDGDTYDSYQNVPELSLKFEPIVNDITLNGGEDISLIAGTTTAVFATGTVSDGNGASDLVIATSTIYRSGVAGGADCTPNNNNCYVSTTANNSCSFIECSGNDCVIECRADIFFHADPTDAGDFEGQEWFAFVEVEDAGGGYGFNSSDIGVGLNTLRAIAVEGEIDYGALSVNSDTGSFNASTSIINFGNVEADLWVEGTDLSDGNSSIIPASQQKFATSTFTYSSCGTGCQLLSSSTPVQLDVDLAKPAIDNPPVADEVFWGIAVPFGVNSVPHQGINVFTPISP